MILWNARSAMVYAVIQDFNPFITESRQFTYAAVCNGEPKMISSISSGYEFYGGSEEFGDDDDAHSSRS